MTKQVGRVVKTLERYYGKDAIKTAAGFLWGASREVAEDQQFGQRLVRAAQALINPTAPEVAEKDARIAIIMLGRLASDLLAVLKNEEAEKKPEAVQ